jgi:hypothetical protein
MEVAEVCWGGAGGDTMACGRERTPKRKASHRGHGGHGGGWRLWLKLLAVTPWAAGENQRRKECIAQRS